MCFKILKFPVRPSGFFPSNLLYYINEKSINAYSITIAQFFDLEAEENTKRNKKRVIPSGRSEMHFFPFATTILNNFTT
jgi:hypothetical protein